MTERSGQCMCGAVSFVARDVQDTFGVCHCEMCRRWTGSALLEVSLPTENVSWRGEGKIKTRKSSAWAERAWCDDCGTGLYFKVTQEGEFFGKVDLPIGLFDDPDGFRMSHEIYIDHKPDSFAFVADGHTQLTRADCVAKFPLLDSE